MATIARFPDTEDDAAILAALRADGAVLVDRFVTPETIAAIEDESAAAVAAAEPGMRTINPMIQAFFGPCTKHVSALAAVSPTFADEVMTHGTYRALCDAVLLPSCSRYRLNLGHLIARGPGADMIGRAAGLLVETMNGVIARERDKGWPGNGLTAVIKGGQMGVQRL